MQGLRSKWFIVSFVTLAGCGGLTESEQLPPGVRDPAATRTPEGALAAYHSVRGVFREALAGRSADGVVKVGAVLTDEFGSPAYGQRGGGGSDIRDLPDGSREDRFYGSLHQVRGEASEAVGLLAAYAPHLSPALRAHAYALTGYAEVLLADLFCSGIPLSTLDFGGDYTLRPGSSTEAVYEHAVALFDTALTLAADSARILHLAQVGKARAQLALGHYDSAGQAVAAVPDGFSYAVPYDGEAPNFMIHFGVTPDGDLAGPGTMTDREGLNGFDYLSSGDPRVAWDSLGNNKWGFPLYRPAKYDPAGTGPMVVADWIEARLIEAEAALHAGDAGTWLAKLNHLRQTAWTTIRPTIDTALADLTDPGADEARVNLLFRERAFWLFLTGHRQGDLRRLVRNYGRDPDTVYPTGPYPGGQAVYGTDVTLSVPPQERELNPHYRGCFNREA